MVAAFAGGVVWWAAACDGGPSGPGALRVTVDAPEALGAVTLEVVGPGVTGFEGIGDTEAFGSVVSGRENRHRVVLVSRPGGRLEVAVLVDDVGSDPPVISVVAAAGTDDLERITTDVSVRVGGP
jgi:hypothetical protein